MRHRAQGLVLNLLYDWHSRSLDSVAEFIQLLDKRNPMAPYQFLLNTPTNLDNNPTVINETLCTINRFNVLIGQTLDVFIKELRRTVYSACELTIFPENNHFRERR